MTDETTFGSDSPESGNPDGASGSGDEGSNAGTGAFLDALSEDNRRLAEERKLDSPDKIFNSYRELSTKLGDTLRVPGDDADNDAWDKFYSRAGRPDKPDGYTFKMPEGLSEDFPYDADSASKFAEWAHEAGLNPRQAQTLHDRFVQDLNSDLTSATQSDAEARKTAHEAIVKEWGEPDSETYKRNVELSRRAIRELGGDALEESFKAHGLFAANGAVADSAIAFALQKIGSELFREDDVFSGEARSRNPFDPKTENITEQGRILRSDPDSARDMIRAAGREKDFARVFNSQAS